MSFLGEPFKALKRQSITAFDTMKKSLSWKVDDVDGSDSDPDSDPDPDPDSDPGANPEPVDAHSSDSNSLRGQLSSRLEPPLRVNSSVSVTGPPRPNLRISAEHAGGYSSSPASPTGALEKRGIGRKNSLSETLSQLVLSSRSGGRSRGFTQDTPTDEGPPTEPSQMTRKQRVRPRSTPCSTAA